MPQSDPRSHRANVRQTAAPLLQSVRRREADEPKSHESFVSSVRDKMVRFLFANVILFGLICSPSPASGTCLVWVVAMATWLPLVTRIRNIAEHA